MKLGVPATSSSTSSTKTRQKVQSTLKVCWRRVKVDRVQNGAQERTRTSTPLRELAPEASASANSATWAIRATKTGLNHIDASPLVCQRSTPPRGTIDLPSAGHYSNSSWLRR